jgi:hypothetical protein
MKKFLTGLFILGLGVGFPACLGSFLIETSNTEDIIIDNEVSDDFLQDKDEAHKKKKPKDPIVATIDIHPNVLNFKSKGNWMTIYITLPNEYDVNNININTVLLNDEVPASTKTEIIDIDNDNLLDLMIKFSRNLVKNTLELQEFCIISITGKMFEGNEFEGTDIIKLIHF